MRIQFLIIFFICFCLKTKAQPGDATLKQMLDSVLYYSKATSLYTEKVNWDTIKKNVFSLSKEAKTINELKPAFTYILNTLGDHHGRYINATNYSAIAYFTDWDKHNAKSTDKRERKDEVISIINDTALKFSYKLLPQKIGYLKIVGIGPTADVKYEATKIRNAIATLSKKGVIKWIVDLRYNGGGNMNPMMAGVAPLLNQGSVGYMSNDKGDTTGRWVIKNNNFLWDDYLVINMPKAPLLKPNRKIAVLTSRYTVSSGEFVATTFKGNTNTKFFGEATGGYSTTTNWININDKIIVCIAEGFYCDRNGKEYRINLPVDEEANFNANENPQTDDGIIKATKWLTKNK